MQSPFKNAGTVYQIMHMEKTVAEISDTGKARIISALPGFCRWTGNTRKKY